MDEIHVPEERRTIMAGPLSKGTRYSLAVEGVFGSREIRNLMTFLQLQLEWTAEEESALSSKNQEGGHD